MIVIDGKLTEHELDVLRNTLKFIENKVEKENLLNYAKNRLRPKLTAPPQGLDPKVLKLIYFEVLNHFVVQADLGEKEQIFVRQLANVCEFDKIFSTQAVQWCDTGIAWRKKAHILHAQVELA